MNQNLQIRVIPFGTSEYKELRNLRDDILRKPLGLTLLEDDESTEINSFHFGCFEKNKLLGCLVLTPLDQESVKMRQVAVATAEQGRGIGNALVKFSETFAKANNFKKIVLNARETAVQFYLKGGYKVEGEKFIEVTIPHFKMVKIL